MSEIECDHPGRHAIRVQCPDCGRFSAHGWDTGWYYTQNGGQQDWGGICKEHGHWSESAA